MTVGGDLARLGECFREIGKSLDRIVTACFDIAQEKKKNKTMARNLLEINAHCIAIERQLEVVQELRKQVDDPQTNIEAQVSATKLFLITLRRKLEQLSTNDLQPTEYLEWTQGVYKEITWLIDILDSIPSLDREIVNRLMGVSAHINRLSRTSFALSRN